MNRKEAIEILSSKDNHGMPCGYTGGYAEAIDMAIEALKEKENMIPIDGEDIMFVTAEEYKAHEWIPCGERLPVKSGFYICTVNKTYKHVRQMKYEMIESGYRWLLMNGTEVQHEFVLAWMQLPEPYNE